MNQKHVTLASCLLAFGMTDTQCNITAVCYLKPFYAVAVIACENQRYKYGTHYYQQGYTAVYHNIRYQAVTFFLR